MFLDILFGTYRYRKALRMMRHADHHGFPILTFIDTPGAYAGVKAEELGQVISILLPKITASV
jgi:acetyl-CoA carboxylase alpha subunit